MLNNWFFWACLSALFAAVTALLSKLGLRGVNPDQAQLVRTAIVLLCVATWTSATGNIQEVLSLSKKSLIILTLAGLATAISWTCYYRALSIGDASGVATVDKLSVPLIAVASVYLLGEKISSLGWIGVLMAFVGVALIAYSK